MYTLFRQIYQLRQTYRHLVQQAIVRQEMRSVHPSFQRSMAWETGGIAALLSAAAACGILAQAHLGGSIL